MIQKNLKGFVGLAAGTFAVSLVAGAFAFTTIQSPATPDEHHGAKASWVSTAQTVAEQALEADVMVRVQAVDRAQPRHLWNPMPDAASRIDGRSTFAFTDTQVEVLEVYHGDVQVGDRLWVLQTGGDLRTQGGKLSRMELAADPLYEVGDEMVLFLVNISGDPVHAVDRELFRTVNPAGRYQVDGGLAARGDELEKAAFVGLDALELEIQQAVADRLALER